MASRMDDRALTRIVVCLAILFVVLSIGLLYWVFGQMGTYDSTEYSLGVISSQCRDVNGSDLWDISVRVDDVDPEGAHETGLWRELGLRITLKDGTVVDDYARIATFTGNLTDSPSFFVKKADHLKIEVGDELIFSGLDLSYQGAEVQLYDFDARWGAFKLPGTFDSS